MSTLRFRLAKAFNKAPTDKLIAQLNATTSLVSWFTALARPFAHTGLLIAFLNSDCMV